MKQDPMVERWYEAFTDAVNFLGKSWPDGLTDWEAGFCERAADREAPRPLAERIPPSDVIIITPHRIPRHG